MGNRPSHRTKEEVRLRREAKDQKRQDKTLQERKEDTQHRKGKRGIILDKQEHDKGRTRKAGGGKGHMYAHIYPAAERE